MAPWCLIPCPRWQSWGTHVNLCSFCAYPSPDVDLFWPPSPVGCWDAWVWPECCCFVLLLSFCYCSCPAHLSHDQVHFVAFSPCLNGGGTVGQFFDTELWQPPSPLGEVLTLCCLSLARLRAEEGYWWWCEPFQYANYVMVQMTFCQCNWVLNYSFLSLPVQYVKL